MKCARCGFAGGFEGGMEVVTEFAALMGYFVHKAGGIVAIPYDELSVPKGMVLQILPPKGDTRDWILTLVDRQKD